jgi:hypothetical protein
MKLRGVLLLAGGVFLATSSWFGCTDIKQITNPDPDFETLTVAYGDPGLSPDPCNDYLPIIDGVGTAQEWSLAEPLFVRMTGVNGSGGPDFFVEVRALWTNESKVEGGTDRIYFLIRYPDRELNADPDQLAYIRPLQEDEFCRNTLEIAGALYCPSPIPVSRGILGDPKLVDPAYWTRINPNGQEDQVSIAIREVAGEAAESGLIDLDRSLLSVIGPPDIPANWRAPDNVSDVDVWVWRAGRTNLHPVNQFPDWTVSYDANGFPDPRFSKFLNTCGFAEDMWINESGSLADDEGKLPFTKNYEGPYNVNGVPQKMAACPPSQKEPSDSDLAGLNGGVPKELGLWWRVAIPFKGTDTLVCTRSSAHPPKWSGSLLLGEWDFVPGWGLQIPNVAEGSRSSSADVRAKGTQEEKQEKGFGVRTVEFMRAMNTGRSDDVAITATSDLNNPKEYRVVIGVFNDSGAAASGSSEIRLRFEAPKPKLVGSINRCS